MSHPVNFGQLIVINSSFCSYITAKNEKNDFTAKEHGMGQSRQICKKYFLRILKVVRGPLIHTIKEPYQCSKMLADNVLSGVN
jgi:hypothetical protein